MTQVFISYSRKDLEFVEQLATDLKGAGFEVWYDVSGISSGSQWRIEIENGLRNSQFVIVVLSPDSILSDWVEREFLFASDLKLKIIPLMHRACKLPLSYLNLNVLDVQGTEYHKNWPRLLQALSVAPQNVTPPVATTAPATTFDWKNRYFVSAIILLAFVLGGFSLWRLNGKQAPIPPTATIESNTPIAETATFTVEPATSTPTITMSPEPTATKEPGFAIVDPEEVLNIAPSLRTFGQLAVEKYSIEERNKINNTLTFTVNSTTGTSILWRWFWCAANDRILEQNMSKISILFDADGYVIPEEQLATVVFENGDPTYAGWKCRTYETVVRDWKPGTYKFIQTMTIASPINDGDDKFEAGYKIYEYTVNIAPE